MDTAHAAKLIRAQLKEQGISRRQVSVRIERFSMGSSINVEIKDPTVSFRKVEAVAKPFERVRRCNLTGEILSGGNTYLSVGYAEGALGLLTAAIEAGIEVFGEYASAVATVRPAGQRGYFEVNVGDWHGEVFGAGHAATQIAQKAEPFAGACS